MAECVKRCLSPKERVVRCHVEDRAYALKAPNTSVVLPCCGASLKVSMGRRAGVPNRTIDYRGEIAPLGTDRSTCSM